jgi:low affinity Fe/Cu permease
MTVPEEAQGLQPLGFGRHSAHESRHMDWFIRISKATARFAGHPTAFLLAVAVVVLWLLSGPVFGFSDTWQLVINTATTIVTFLMVFLIQGTQNQDAIAVQIKLDELIRSHKAARNAVLDLEEYNDRELEDIRRGYELLAEQARHHQSRRHGQGQDEPGVERCTTSMVSKQTAGNSSPHSTPKPS